MPTLNRRSGRKVMTTYLRAGALALAVTRRAPGALLGTEPRRRVSVAGGEPR